MMPLLGCRGLSDQPYNVSVAHALVALTVNEGANIEFESLALILATGSVLS